MMEVTTTAEHEWLQQIVGEWNAEGEANMGPDNPAEHWKATESMRPVGKVWVQGEGRSDGPDGSQHISYMTLGYNPETKRFVGTFISSMMTHLWIYDGELDAARKVLTLHAEGPDFGNPGKTAKYQDIIEIVSPAERTLTSKMQMPDGSWNRIMFARYKRVK